MRTFSAKTLAALQSGSVALVQLLKMDFSGTPIYLNSSTWDLVWQRLYNLLTYSDGVMSTYPVRGGSVSDAAGAIAGFTNAVSMQTHVSGSFLYKTHAPTVGDTYTLSVFLKMDDLGVPVPTTSTGSGDLCLVVCGVVTASTAVHMGADIYRISATKVATAGTTMGVVKYAGQSVRGFTVTGYQFEPGELATTYTPTTATALTDPGLTYKGAFGLGQISAITDKPGEVQGINLELHGADAARISLALDDSDIVQGTPVEIRTALIDTTTYQILDAPVEWVGTMDTMSIAEDGTSATIAVTCESKAVDLLRGNVAMYSDADQRAINPTDASFSYVVDQIDKPIVWPSREFFYK